MKKFIKTTEAKSYYNDLEKMDINKILSSINKEDESAALAVKKSLPQIKRLTKAVYNKMIAGGKLYYIGAGTSGRLGILDASECPPTFGVSEDLIQGIIAGGTNAITKSVEDAEDDQKQGWKDLLAHEISNKDFVIGIAASGTTPYVLGTLKKCRKKKISTGCITNNIGSPIAAISDFKVEINTGPEFITGSTRMKAGTTQKMVLNMISTTVMIKLGHIKGNLMINMQLKNKKLKERGIKILMEKGNIQNVENAKKLLIQFGSVKKVLTTIQKT